MRLTGFEDLITQAAHHGQVRVAVAAAADLKVLEGIKQAQDLKLIQAILVGDEAKILEQGRTLGLDWGTIEIVHAADPKIAAEKAAEVVSTGQVDILMKGLVNTADFLRAVLRPEMGLKNGGLLSHLAAFEIAGFSHLIFATDCAMNIAPQLEEKREILSNALAYLKHLGLETVRTVVLAANETPHPKMPATLDAVALVRAYQEGDYPGALIEGPFALDCALNAQALQHKGIVSEIQGDPDLLLMPNLEAGNIFYKALVYLAGAASAGILLGAKVPIVLTSRNDSPASKLASLALAAFKK